MGKAFSHVCLSVHALTGKRLELSTPNLVHIYSIAVARHALTHRSKSQRSRSQDYENRHSARLLVTMAGTVYSCAMLPAAVSSVSACRYNCLCFLVLHHVWHGNGWRFSYNPEAHRTGSTVHAGQTVSRAKMGMYNLWPINSCCYWQ